MRVTKLKVSEPDGVSYAEPRSTEVTLPLAPWDKPAEKAKTGWDLVAEAITTEWKNARQIASEINQPPLIVSSILRCMATEGQIRKTSTSQSRGMLYRKEP